MPTNNFGGCVSAQKVRLTFEAPQSYPEGEVPAMIARDGTGIVLRHLTEKAGVLHK